MRFVVILTTALVLSLPASGGQSLVLTPSAPAIPVADPPYPQNNSWRVEFQLHDWTLPATTTPARIFVLPGLGAAALLRSDGLLDLESLRDLVVQRQPCFVKVGGARNVLVRIQRNVPAMLFTCEVWNYDSTGYNTQTLNLSTLGTSNGAGALGGGANASLGFLRAFTTVLPLGSRPPVTADSGDWTELKFDGNLNDSSGNGHGGGGGVVFTPTPNQAAVALPKTAGAPFWSNWTSLRAGFPAQLDGSASYSLADASSAVAYSWTQISGPSTVVWTNANMPTPTIQGLVFGTYSFQLAVTDAAGVTGTQTLTAGAVATDSNGVVVQANPAADAIFGPMIAFGKNPWGWADERNLKMENLQANTYATPPVWSSPAEAATVSYTYFNPASAPAATTLAADIGATDLTIPVNGTGSLDLSTLPTQVLVGNPAAWEVVRVCSVSDNALNVCYDGRGFHYGYDASYLKNASAWKSGTRIWQAKITGSGTHFLTTICPLGPGFQTTAGAVTSAGSVTATPGSTSIRGSGAQWGSSLNGLAIAISATHGGVPFTFFSYVVSAAGTNMTMARAFPADADPGSYSYNVFPDHRNVLLHYTRADGSDGYIYFPTAGCESDTDLYLYMGWDNGYPRQVVPASPYSVIDGFGYVGDLSPNFYDMGLAHYAFYLRSGLTQALTSARTIEDYWMRYPENAQGDAGGSPRDKSILGTLVAAVLDGDRAGNWSGLRSLAKQGYLIAQRMNCDDDLRETAYQMSWLAMAAAFDPDPNQQAQWQNYLATAYKRDSGCARGDFSFASGFYWAAQPTKINLTQGSTTGVAASGTFPTNICYSTANGTATATNGSAMLTALTGSFVPPSGTYKLLVGGTMNGARYDLSTQFAFNSAGTLTMSALWPGDSGTVYWSIENNDSIYYVMSIAQGPADSDNFGRIASCSRTDSTHLELYRPWPGASGTYSYFYYNLVGRGTQPFMAGIKALQMRLAALSLPSYQDLLTGISNWVASTGFDPQTKGIFYGRVFPQCEPAVTDAGTKTAVFRMVSCIESAANIGALQQARARNAEAQNAMTSMYLANPTDANRATGDIFYGATYGAPGYTAPGYWSDGITASNLDDFSLSIYKWPGFFFGIGMAHQWPAARLGGVAPPQYRSVSIPFTLGGDGAGQIVVTAPSGAVTNYPCSLGSACGVQVDDRQGAHWAQLQTVAPDGTVLSLAAPYLLPAAGQ